MTGRSSSGSITSITASHTSTAKSGSVRVKLSGEYSYRTTVSPSPSSSLRHSLAPLTAMSTIPALSRPNTTSRWRGLVEL